MRSRIQNPKIKMFICSQDYIINVTDKRGWSALFHAVSRRRQDAVAFLLKHGADVNLMQVYPLIYLV
jgi:ankyrin repeat protein